MNKTQKGCLKIFILFIIVFTSLIIWLIWYQHQKEKQAKIDSIKQYKICNNSELIAEQHKINFYSFNTAEIEKINFYLIRKNKIIKDTTIEPNSIDFDFPFRGFKKTDTIVVKTKSNLFFRIFGFHYEPNLHYGMFGYLGHSDCRFTCDVNGSTTETTISVYKDDAIEMNILPNKASH